jgi:putative transposon-encoded protein
MARRKEILILQKRIEFEDVLTKTIGDFGTGSGHIVGLGDYVGKTAIVIILPAKSGSGKA